MATNLRRDSLLIHRLKRKTNYLAKTQSTPRKPASFIKWKSSLHFFSFIILRKLKQRSERFIFTRLAYRHRRYNKINLTLLYNRKCQLGNERCQKTLCALCVFARDMFFLCDFSVLQKIYSFFAQN